LPPDQLLAWFGHHVSATVAVKMFPTQVFPTPYPWRAAINAE
jgi:hypothetical protein